MHYLYMGGGRRWGLPIVGFRFINLGQLHSEGLFFCTGHFLVRPIGIPLLMHLKPPINSWNLS